MTSDRSVSKTFPRKALRWLCTGLTLFCLAFYVPHEASAQEMPSWTGSGSGSPRSAPDRATPPPAQDNPPDFPVPLDPVGLALLAAAGGALAVRRLHTPEEA